MSTEQADYPSLRHALPETVDWQPFPAFPPTAELAVVQLPGGDDPRATEANRT